MSQPRVIHRTREETAALRMGAGATGPSPRKMLAHVAGNEESVRALCQQAQEAANTWSLLSVRGIAFAHLLLAEAGLPMPLTLSLDTFVVVLQSRGFRMLPASAEVPQPGDVFIARTGPQQLTDVGVVLKPVVAGKNLDEYAEKFTFVDAWCENGKPRTRLHQDEVQAKVVVAFLRSPCPACDAATQ